MYGKITSIQWRCGEEKKHGWGSPQSIDKLAGDNLQTESTQKEKTNWAQSGSFAYPTGTKASNCLLYTMAILPPEYA